MKTQRIVGIVFYESYVSVKSAADGQSLEIALIRRQREVRGNLVSPLAFAGRRDFRRRLKVLSTVRAAIRI